MVAKGSKDKSDEIHFPPLFGKYELSEVVIEDKGLGRYINLEPITVLHVGGRYANKKFGKSKVNIVERLIISMMRTEHYTGKKAKAYRVVQDAFEIINDKTKMNPIQVLINALQNVAPKEEVTTLRYGGISVPKAVDVSPARRLDISLRNLCRGAVQASHKNRKPIASCLAEELTIASKGEMTSFAVTKKEEMERIARSAR